MIHNLILKFHCKISLHDVIYKHACKQLWWQETIQNEIIHITPYKWIPKKEHLTLEYDECPKNK